MARTDPSSREARSPIILPGSRPKLLPKQQRHTIDHQPGQPAHHCAVDADELKIAANLQLDLIAGYVGVPFAHRMRNQLAKLVAILLAGVDNQALHPAIDFVGQQIVAQQQLTELAHAVLDGRIQG